MTNTTQVTVEHIKVASNRSYDQVTASLRERWAPLEIPKGCEPNCRPEHRGHRSRR
jgi:hypothetical protein